MLLGIHLTLLIGPTVPVPAPATVTEALVGVEVTHNDEGVSGFSLTFQAGRSGRVDTDDVNKLVSGVINVMRYLNMLAGKPTMVEHPVWIERIDTLSGDQPGIFYPLVDRGTYVQQGMEVGYVTDFYGKTVQEARAPAAGVVLYVGAVPSMKKGDTIANIGIVASSPPQ